MVAGGGERYAQRHRDRGKLLVRERIELLVDPDSPFLELSPLAAWGTDVHGRRHIVTGIGVVSGVECVIIAHDPTVRGGTMNPYTLRKKLRALEIARVNRLPVVNLVESGGADLPTQADLFVPAGQIFHDLTELSALGIPTSRWSSATRPPAARTCPACATTPCWSTARPRCSSAARRWSRWPPARRPTTRRSAAPRCTPASPACPTTSPSTSATPSASAARSDPHQLAQARAGPRRCPEPPLYDPDELLGIVSPDPQVPFDPREVLARIVDGSEFDEYKPLYGTSLVTGGRRSTAIPVGVLANHRGVLFSEEAKKATEFILLANQTDTPLIFLQNTTGYMVGADTSRAGSSRTAPR